MDFSKVKGADADLIEGLAKRTHTGVDYHLRGVGAQTHKPNVQGTTEKERTILKLADELVNNGTMYAWGAGNPANGSTRGVTDGGGEADVCGDSDIKGFDCSGLTQYLVMQSTGIDVGKYTGAQVESSVPVKGEPQIGDLGFPTPNDPGHVVMYVGDGKVIEAPESCKQVMYNHAPSDYVWYRPDAKKAAARQ